MPTFTFTQPEFDQNSLELPDGTYSLGRARMNQIIIDEPSISKEHAEILVNGNEVIIRERGSHNGSFIDGVRIAAQSGVRHGQIVRFGRVELVVGLGSPEFEQTTNITAVAGLARLRDQASKPPVTPTRFPVRFAPRGDSPEAPSTVAAPVPQPVAARASPSNPETSSRSGSPQPARSKGHWGWVLLILVSLLVGVVWMLRR